MGAIIIIDDGDDCYRRASNVRIRIGDAAWYQVHVVGEGERELTELCTAGRAENPCMTTERCSETFRLFVGKRR